jgi:hypothetical protein
MNEKERMPHAPVWSLSQRFLMRTQLAFLLLVIIEINSDCDPEALVAL